jgi:hypothetical protein
MKRLVVCMLAALLLGSGAAIATATNGRAPLQLGGMVEGGGGRAGDSNYLPDAHFELGVLVRNTSGSRLVLINAQLVEPPRTLVHQIGSRFHRWNPPHCPPDVAGCLIPGFPMTARPKRPRPLALKAGRQAGVELDFRLGSCSEIPAANLAPLSRVRITVRRPDGTRRDLTLSLGSASIHVPVPNAADCRDPHSSLTVKGPQRYTSGDKRAIAGSTGDVCSVRNGRLYFASRKYRTSGKSYERLTLQVGHYVIGRTGTFRKTTLKLVSDQSTVLRVHPVVHVTTGTNREVLASLRASHPPFLVSGTVRCRVIR